MATDADIRTLHREVTEVQRKHPDLSLDNAFVHWFLTAYLVESEKSLNGAIVGGANDKGVDAIYVDHDNEKVFLVQGKYHIAKSPHAETHSDVMSFAGLAKTLHGEKSDLENLLANADPVVRDGLRKIWRFFRHRRYGLELYYVSTGKISPSLDKEAQHYVSMASDRAEFYAFGKEKILKLLKDWLDGAAPPVPLLDLPVEVREGLRGGGMIERYDRSTGIESWVFSMLASDIGRMYTRAKTRLFARNIRGFLGSTEINRGMRNTLRTQPENFWYFNNGVTVVCDGAKRITEHGKETLRVFNPQVINGQQTTRVLEEGGAKRASVLVRVIAVPSGQDHSNRFEGLVNSIVAATNWQNAIKQSDLRANDFEQVRIDREFRRLNYQYLRKRQSKGEVKRQFGTPGRFQIKKEQLARAVAAAELDPASVLTGTEKLFENDYYTRIFDGRPAKDYLALVWLDRHVNYAARGRERRYARWLALNYIWRSLQHLLRREPVKDRFLYLSERVSEWNKLRKLDRFIRLMLRAALTFYRHKRGKGIEAMDLFTFFKQRKLDVEFDKYLVRSGSVLRGRARKALARFEKVLISEG